RPVVMHNTQEPDCIVALRCLFSSLSFPFAIRELGGDFSLRGLCSRGTLDVDTAASPMEVLICASSDCQCVLFLAFDRETELFSPSFQSFLRQSKSLKVLLRKLLVVNTKVRRVVGRRGLILRLIFIAGGTRFVVIFSVAIRDVTVVVLGCSDMLDGLSRKENGQ
ncbi:hypothetical protein DFS34DRAFT_635340, partial [Phlyctochytrium arcticum]